MDGCGGKLVLGESQEKGMKLLLHSTSLVLYKFQKLSFCEARVNTARLSPDLVHMRVARMEATALLIMLQL